MNNEKKMTNDQITITKQKDNNQLSNLNNQRKR